MNRNRRTRRDFLADAGMFAGSGWLAFNAPMLLAAGQAAAEQRAAGANWSHLAESEARTLSALVDQVIPPDDLPGAAEVGVVYFIDQALGGFMADAAGPLREGLADLDRRALEGFPGSGGFADLAFEQQTALCRSIETTRFFNQVIFLTHCGMFASPAWGGNRDRAGWALLGFDNRHAWQPPFGYYDAQLVAGEGDANG
jgi:gluconate 2-dehydrogenase gamma chain